MLSIDVKLNKRKLTKTTEGKLSKFRRQTPTIYLFLPVGSLKIATNKGGWGNNVFNLLNKNKNNNKTPQQQQQAEQKPESRRPIPPV